MKMNLERKSPGSPAPSDLNVLVGWTSMALGAGTGLILGLWSFNGPLPVPEWIGDYADTSRRMIRLGHIAFFGLGYLNLLFAREAERQDAGDPLFRLASRCLVVGNALMPPLLFVSAWAHPFKYAVSIPAVSVLLGLVCTACGVWQSFLRRTAS